MKKLLAIIMVVCMLVSVLCVPAFAANEPAAGTKLRVSAIRYNGSTKVLGDYDDFEKGWNDAMWLAGREEAMEEEGYDRVVVTLYADWNAKDGKFTDDNRAGFDNDTIYIPENAVVTLNLNNHTINRGLTEDIDDGEVIFINDDADVIIENGTITGGYSNSEGGALCIDGANVTLNNVNIVGNRVYNDDGAGIAMYSGTTLTVNGGTFENNKTDGNSLATYYGAAVYAADSTATFKNVAFKNNDCKHKGSAIYADDCDIIVDNCTFDGNKARDSVVYAEDSYVNVTESTFVNSNSYYVLELDASNTLVLNSSVFKNNEASYIISIGNTGKIFVTDSEFTDNNAGVMYAASSALLEGSFLRNCTFNNTLRDTDHNGKAAGSFRGDFSNVTFFDCSFGNSKLQYAENVNIENSESSDADAVISVTLLHKDGTKKTVRHATFDIGWNFAMQAAKTDTYERVIVDLHAHWYAEDGQFTDEFMNGDGFNWDAIYVPAGVKVTLNMNTHIINRSLTEAQENGEVIAIGEGADVIINDGSFRGGWSVNGAGGIHIFDNANVTLNNVHIIGNQAASDDGAGIAMYDGATLTMNGGQISSNILHEYDTNSIIGDIGDRRCKGAGIYIEDSTATFNNVSFSNNYNYLCSSHGGAIYATDSNVTINGCAFNKNGNYWGRSNPCSFSVIYADDSTLTVKDSTFSNNGGKDYDDYLIFLGAGSSGVFQVDNSTLLMDNCKFNDNLAWYCICDVDDSLIQVTNTIFENNDSAVLCGDSDTSDQSFFKKCKFKDTGKYGCKDFYGVSTVLTFYECDMGDSTYSECTGLKFVDCGATGYTGSIFGEGSLVMIIAVLALVSSAVSISLTIVFNKKKAVLVTATEAKNEDEAKIEDEE